MKNYNTILIEKLQKYQSDNHTKLINMNISWKITFLVRSCDTTIWGYLFSCWGSIWKIDKGSEDQVKNKESGLKFLFIKIVSSKYNQKPFL